MSYACKPLGVLTISSRCFSSQEQHVFIEHNFFSSKRKVVHGWLYLPVESKLQFQYHVWIRTKPQTVRCYDRFPWYIFKHQSALDRPSLTDQPFCDYEENILVTTYIIYPYILIMQNNFEHDCTYIVYPTAQQIHHYFVLTMF